MATSTAPPPSITGSSAVGRAAQVILSSPTKPKRPVAWVAIGTGLVVLCALGGLLLTMGGRTRVPALVTARPLVPGQAVSVEDFRVVRLAGAEDLSVVSPTALDAIVGKTPSGPVPAGVTISAAMFDAPVLLAAGESVIGAALPPGAVPIAGLQPGATVQMIITSPSSGATPGQPLIVGNATVWSIAPLESAATAGQMWVSLKLPESVAAQVAQSAQDNSLRLALVGASG